VIFIKIYNNLDSILRNLLVAGNIVTVSYEQMRERYAKNWADLLSLSFRELR
jgi:hypothetical protein